LFLALLAALLVWVLIWRTPWGYAVRTVGQSESAAVYAGIAPARLVMQVMFLSGALAGLLGINALMGDQHRLLLGFSTGYGFAGIGVALMGRNHPVGIILASLLFGVLIQGGSELDFEFKLITREIVVLVQGLIILFTGALALLFAPVTARVIHSIKSSRKDANG
jgi:simple sugar transport system permease protein